MPIYTLRGIGFNTLLTQILFGSDWPFTPDFGVARVIHVLGNNDGLTAEQLHAINRGNAERLFPKFARRQWRTERPREVLWHDSG